MAEINLRMTGYVADRLGLSWQQASDLRERYWQRYGATLLGLMRHHGVSAREFLHKTHPLDELPNFVQRISGERERLQQLRGEKWLLAVQRPLFPFTFSSRFSKFPIISLSCRSSTNLCLMGWIELHLPNVEH